MAHPDEQSHAVVAPALVHGPVTLIVDPLSPFTKLLSRCWLTKVIDDQLVERGTALSTLHRVVVAAPIQVLRPQVLGLKCTAQSLVGHDIGHAALGVQLACLLLEVLLRAQCVVRSMAAHAIIGRTGDIIQSVMQ